MAFIEEKILEEEDKKVVDSFNFIDPLRNEPSNPRYWIVDRERNAFLVAIGGGG